MDKFCCKAVLFAIFILTSSMFLYIGPLSAGINELGNSLGGNCIQDTSETSVSAVSETSVPPVSASSTASATAEVTASGDTSGVVMGSYLNVRNAPWGDIIGRLSRAQKVDILGREGEWFIINYKAKKAYIHSGYIATVNKPAVAFCGYVSTGGGNLNIRSGPWGSILGTLSDGARIEVLGREGDWSKIRYNGRDAYIYSKYTSKTAGASSASSSLAKSSASSKASAAASSADKSTGSKTSSAALSAPLSGTIKVGSKYGMRFHPILKYNRMHNGVDIGKSTGTPLLSMGSGKVIYSGWSNGGGYMVKIKYDNGYTSTYMHCLGSGALAVGAKVEAGQQVAKVNNTGMSTGSHLHLEIWNPQGQRINPETVL